MKKGEEKNKGQTNRLTCESHFLFLLIGPVAFHTLIVPYKFYFIFLM